MKAVAVDEELHLCNVAYWHLADVFEWPDEVCFRG